MKKSFSTHVVAGCLLAVPAMAWSADDTAGLLEMNIQELMDVDVTSASKSAKPLSETSAAVTVVSQEDIRRSGANSIPDVLRFVPGLQVAQMTNNQWSVSARGFGGIYSNKLLVMVDGRSIYNPVYGGVYWDQQNLMLQDIERIEVVRGPGATLWGANAVNGIINIISKRAADTQGGLLAGGGGNQETGFGAARYGGQIGDNAYYRVYAKHNTRDNFDKISDPSPLPFGRFASERFENRDNNDRSQDSRGGFRLDWDASAQDSTTFQGDFYQGGQDRRSFVPMFQAPGIQTLDDTVQISGENLLGRWKHRFDSDLSTETQVYWDHYRRTAALTGIEDVHTYDLDSQLNYRLNDWNDMVAGGGYRYISDDLSASDVVFYRPQSRKISNFNVFIQDNITLIPDTLDFTAGVKYEHNGYSGSQAQPSGRLMWKINEEQRAWAAVSHATRSAVRTDQNLNINFARFQFPGSCNAPVFFPPGQPLQNCEFRITGIPQFGSEKEDSFELGYRFTPSRDWSVDLTGFYNRYSDLTTKETGSVFLSDGQNGTFYRPYSYGQYGSAETLGAEASANWQVTRDWRLSANYSYLRTFMHKSPRSNDTDVEFNREEHDAQNMAGLRSLFNLTDKVELDGTVYYMDSRPYEVSAMPGVHPSSYFRVDARIGWSPVPRLQLDLIGQNLIDNRHLEYVDAQGVIPSEIPRSVFARAQWQF